MYPHSHRTYSVAFATYHSRRRITQMIDMHSEHMLSISAAARATPGKPHVSTLWRWINRGCRGVKLDALRVGGVRFTSKEALQRFAERVTAVANGQAIPTQTAHQRKRSEAKADRILDAAGV